MIRRRLSTVVVQALPLAAGLFVLSLWASVLAGATDQRVVVNMLISVVLAVGLQAFSGNSGIVSFGHLAFMAVGAYVAALAAVPPALKDVMQLHLPGALAHAQAGFVLAVGLGTVAAALVAAIVGFFLSRMREDAMSMATIGLLVIAYVVANNWTDVTRGTTGIYGVPATTTLWAAFGAAVVAIVFGVYYRTASAGLRLRASREDALAAAALGADVRRLRLGAWIVSGAIMGCGGSVWALYNLAFNADAFYFAQTFSLLAMVVIGGLATVSGAVTGAVVVSIVTEALRRAEASLDLGVVHLHLPAGSSDVVLSAWILFVLYRWPDGFAGLTEIGDRIAKRLRTRRRRAVTVGAPARRSRA
jgi:branched-chain amino acid transport system permease protein